MTSYEMKRGLKSAIAAAVSASLFVTTTALPAAAQYRAGASAEAGTSARVFAPVSGVSPVPSLPNGIVESVSLAPTLSAAAVPSLATVSGAAALALSKTIVPGALAPVLPAAAKPEKSGSETPVVPAKPVAAGEEKTAEDAGPRWVKTEGKDGTGKVSADAGPRWVGPAKSPARRFVEKYLPFLASKDGAKEFDGAAEHQGTVADAPVASKGAESSAKSGLGKSERSRIIQDLSVPTPAAVAKTAALDKKPVAGPRWVKTLAPLVIIGGAALLTPASLVPAAVITASLMFSILAHETAHILGLRIWGDKTPKLAGRDSLNPFAHISMLGTVLVPAASLVLSMSTIGFPVLFGWAKPVPVDFNNLKNPKTDAAKVAILGPLTNLALAAVAGAVYLAFPAAGVLTTAALTLFKMNAALTVFNLLPLPQLDGGKVLVSLLPKSWYARWTHDPKLPLGYQSLYKRIYEGPANLLSKLHVHSFEHVNTLTRVASLAALGAFYAAFYSVLSVPLLFLALPCSYDYWCIREKVRSEAAVQDLMEIMSQWSAVIVQIAEDRGLESEVSAYETEHAMKNALETLVDEMMAKEEFRLLSNEAKLEALLKAYPDKAAEFLKEKAMTEDSLESIKAVLADPRNAPFYERLRKWFNEHEIFERWDNPHNKEKLKDSLKEADKEKGRGAGSFQPFSVAGAVTALAAKLFSAPVMRLGDDDLDDAAADAVLRKVHALADEGPGSFTVKFNRGVSDAEIARVLQGLDHEVEADALDPEYKSATVVVADLARPEETARRIAGESSVTSLLVHPSLRSAMLPQPAAAFPWSKVTSWDGRSVSGISVQLVAGATAADAARLFDGLEYSAISEANRYYDVLIANRTDSALIARRLARDAQVETITVNPELRERMELPSPTPVGADAALAPRPASWMDKVKLNNGYPQKRVRVVFETAVAAREAFRVASSPKEMKGATVLETTARTAEEAAELARAYAAEARVKTVVVSAFIHSRLLSTSRQGPQAPDAEPAEEPAPEETPAVPETPVAAPKPVLHAKVSSHGKAEFGVNVVLVKFADGVDEEAKLALMRTYGATALYHHGDMVTLSAADAAEAKTKAEALAGEERVAAVKVHPNVAAAMTEDEKPYPDAALFDHDRAIIVEFREGATAETIADYAEVRRLRLVYPGFRGAANKALLEVPKGADVNATLQILIDETAAPHAAAADARPFQEQPGAPDLTPSAAAVAAAAAAVKAEEPAEPALPRRDPAQAWVDFLQNRTLSDGKSKLTDKQIQLLSTLLKPIAKAPGEGRAPIVGRSEEVKRALPIVTSPRGMRNSVILVGEAGVGKTAVAEGLAEMAEEAEYAGTTGQSSHLDFARLKGRWLVELDVNAVLSAEDPVGLLNMILQLLPLLNDAEASKGNKVIVLMDEIQKFFLDPAGTKIANILKGPLRDGKVSVIAATTDKEYKTFIEKDDAFRRRFERIVVSEPTVEQTIRILRAMKGWLEKLHDALLPDQALVDAAKLADQFDKTNFNPDKAIKAVQDAAELSRPDNLRGALSLDIRETWSELTVAVNEARQVLVDKGIASTIALPAEHWNRIAGLVAQAAKLYAERDGVADGQGKVTTEVVKRVIAQKTGIASGQLNLGEEDAARYNAMEEEVAKRVVNQDPALHAIANAIRRNKAGLSNPNRPMGKFLLTGPTGVGKTYLAKELARFLFNDPTAMVRFDMSEFMEEHAAMRLVGAPPSYVGYGEGGQLTEAVRKKPYSVILFDEIEKAHPKVFDMLLQILDDGRLTDGEGRTIDFKNTVIILTSNAGMGGVDGEKYAKLLAKVTDHNERAEIEKTWDAEIDLMVAESLKSRFRPEFLNRLDEDPNSKNKWIRVNRLRQQDVKKIASIQLDEFKALLADRHDTDFSYDQSLVEFLTVEGFSPLYGARPMTAAIEKHIVDPLAQWILKEAAEGKKDARGGRITVTVKDGAIVFTATPKPAKDTKRMTIAGAAEEVAAEVFSMIESLAGGSDETEPSESVFDAMLRRAAPKTEATDGAAKTEPRTAAFFAPGTGLEVRGHAVAAEHNNAKKKDAAVKAAIVEARQDAGLTWDAPVVDVIDAPAGTVGEGWIKQIVKLMKEQATAAGVETPVRVERAIDRDAVRLAVSGAFALPADAQKSLLMHFTGTPPESYLAAQKKADNLNLSARLLWDHNLLDLYRRLSAIPGARMGFSTGPQGTQLWLEIRKAAPQALEAPKTAAASVSGDGGKGTPHQRREMEKAKALMMTVIDQTKLKENDRDGHAIRIAAAEGFATLAQPSDAAVARGLIAAKGWADEATGTIKELDAEWPLALTAALVLEKFGTPADIPMLENMSRRITGTGHYKVPVHNALVYALASLYSRAGLAEIRRAALRAAQIGGGHSGDIKGAVASSVGALGMPADLDLAKSDPDGYLALMKRLGRADELLKIYRDNEAWGKNSDGVVRRAALMLVGESQGPEDNLDRLKNLMKSQTSWNPVGYEMSRAWAKIVTRAGLTDGLGDAIKRYLDLRNGMSGSASTWPILLAYVELAKLSGGAADLSGIEEILDQAPGSMDSLNEMAYFNSPEAWARSLVRSGRFEEYAKPQGLDANGAPKPSKLQAMLASKDRPMKVAAALRAIAYARDPAIKRSTGKPNGKVPEIPVDKASASSSYGGGYYHGW